mgnify:CR=1 FL=1
MTQGVKFGGIITRKILRTLKPYNANASFYDIKEHFQGRKKDEKGNETGRMNTKSDDESYNDLMATLRLALKELAEKITPKIYEYGFLHK